LISRYLLDTHAVVRWLIEPRKLSREQTRVIREALRRHEPLAISAISLLEIAVIFDRGTTRRPIPVDRLLEDLGSSPAIYILPLTIEVALEVASLGSALRDPADRAIVATARISRLKLVTSDQRIIDSKLAPVVA
jgi:PIN domain nuclease of toxin-antitoxin system